MDLNWQGCPFQFWLADENDWDAVELAVEPRLSPIRKKQGDSASRHPD